MTAFLDTALDPTCLERARAGDENALAEVYRAFEVPVRTLAHRIVTPRPDGWADVQARIAGRRRALARRTLGLRVAAAASIAPGSAEQLWRRRVEAMNSLVQLRFAEAQSIDM